jgi:YVTN family beta-propeller protein
VFAFAQEDMRFLPDGASNTTSLIPLNARRATESKPLGGVPGEVLYLPKSNRVAMTVRTPAGDPTAKVALVNLDQNKVEHVVKTGRGSVKFGKFMGAMALSIAMSSLSYYAGYSMAQATGSPYFFYNVYLFTPRPPNLELSASPDEKFIYALNSQTNDVTVIDASDGTTKQKIAVGGGCRRVAVAPDGRFLYSFTGGQVNLIDTQSNQNHLEHHSKTGKIRNLLVLEREKRLVALTGKAVVVFDAEKGEIAHTIDGFNEPYILVQPGRPEASAQ